MSNLITVYKNLPKFQKIRTSKKRRIKTNKKQEDFEYRELNLLFGSVWGLNDRSVPFDRKRKDDDYKSALRPSLVLGTPDYYEDYNEVSLAPGTSKYHSDKDPNNPCLIAEVPPENLKRTTYFLLYYSWTAKLFTIDRKLAELSVESKNKLAKILENRS